MSDPKVADWEWERMGEASREAGRRTGPGWWHPKECINLHDGNYNCVDAIGEIIGWRERVVDAILENHA